MKTAERVIKARQTSILRDPLRAETCQKLTLMRLAQCLTDQPAKSGIGFGHVPSQKDKKHARG